jgi:hypothetical protein
VEVPRDIAHTGFLAMTVNEMPDPRFDIQIDIPITGRVSTRMIDKRFMAMIEPTTIGVAGHACMGDRSSSCSFKIKGNKVFVTTSRFSRPELVTVRLTAIRRGFLGVYFPVMTEADFHANEAWLKRGFSDARGKPGQ